MDTVPRQWPVNHVMLREANRRPEAENVTANPKVDHIYKTTKNLRTPSP